MSCSSAQSISFPSSCNAELTNATHQNTAFSTNLLGEGDKRNVELIAVGSSMKARRCFSLLVKFATPEGQTGGRAQAPTISELAQIDSAGKRNANVQAAELAWCTTGILLRRRMSAFGTKQTLGQFHDTPFHCALAEMGPSRIMFSVDYPYEEMAPAAAWFNKTELSDADRTRIGRANATKVVQTRPRLKLAAVARTISHFLPCEKSSFWHIADITTCRTMSAFGVIADIRQTLPNVCF